MEKAIKSLHITSVVVSRFARVVIETKMMNEETSAKEMRFSVKLPNSAFITAFKMTVAGKTINGEVKEKQIAENQYQRAITAGRSGGLISAVVRDTQKFDISTNVPAQSIVVFHLVYQELLQRKLGKYDHVILINPEQIVEKFLVETTIIENTGLTFLEAICGGDEKTPFSVDVIREKTLGKVRFEPSIDEQKKLLNLPEANRKIIARYDVTREVLGGEIQTRNGYFVHYFAPASLPVLPKKVVFIIDTSGSMSGRKIDQTKSAFTSVIKELREIDRFNIVTFNSKIDVWKCSWSDGNLIPATEKNVNAAVKFVKNIKSGGGTNLDDAMLQGAKLLDDVSREDRIASMMILLTDGLPDSSTYEIRQHVQEVNRSRFTIFSLGFGEDVDGSFLERLAEENDGIYRKIYEDSDADIQLKNFFDEVASPLLLHVKISYLGTSVMNVSTSTFGQYFDGSEIVIVGVMPECDAACLKSSAAAVISTGEITYEATSTEITISKEQTDLAEEFENFIEKIWAYFTVKDLLHKIDTADSKSDTEEVKKEALALALKYKFVTSLTSMVVTDLDEDIKKEKPQSTSGGTGAQRFIESGIFADSLNDDYLDFESTCHSRKSHPMAYSRSSQAFNNLSLCACALMDCSMIGGSDVYDDAHLELASVMGNSSKKPKLRKKALPTRDGTVGMLEKQCWYKNVNQHDAHTIVSNMKEDGCFIVRPDDTDASDSYFLTVCVNAKIYDLKIKKIGELSFFLEGQTEEDKTFESIIQLIEHFSIAELIVADGVSVSLRRKEKKSSFFSFFKKN